MYHPAFAKFYDDVTKRTCTPTAEEYTQTHILLEAAAPFYDSEEHRIEALKWPLAHLVGSQVKLDLTGARLDGAMLTGGDGPISKLVADYEFKNEMGIGSADPGLQAGMGYRKFWVQTAVRNTFMFAPINVHICLA